MRPSQAIRRVREKAEETAEKAGEAIDQGWSEAKGLKRKLLRVPRKTDANKKSRARGSRRRQRRKRPVAGNNR